MAYPVKRRRITSETEQPTPTNAPIGPVTHGIQHVAALFHKEERTPPRIDEVHIRVRNYQASKRSHDSRENAHRALHRRQTAASGGSSDLSQTSITPADTPTVTPTPTTLAVPTLPPVVSVSVVVGGDGFLTPITWTFPATQSVELPSLTSVLPVDGAAVTTTTEHEPSSTASTTESSNSSASIPVSDASTSSTASSAPTTDASTAVTTTTLVPTTSGSPDGMIGITPTVGVTTPATTSASSLTTDLASSASSTNATVTDTASVTSSLASLTTSLIDVSSSVNSTGSITASPSGTSTASAASGSITGSSDLLGLFGIIVTTLPNGRISTLSATRSTSLTTMPDGRVSTITGSLVPTTTDATSSASDLLSASPTETATSSSSPTSETGTNYGNDGGNGQSGNSGASPSGGASSGTETENSNVSSTPPPQILAGGIVGGVAGIAAILLVAFIFVRWYRRKGTMRRIDNASSDNAGNRGMAERKGLLPFAAAAGGLLRGRNNKNVAGEERGFQRISGRKLPSAFSGGITGPTGSGPSSPPPVPMPAAFENGSHNRNNGGSGGDRSFYRDSTGYYGGTGNESGSTGTSPGELGPAEIQPGPARQATLHPGGPYGASNNPFDTPPGSPRMPMLEGRSATPVNLDPSYTGYTERSATPLSHHSRFTEEV
ncbi:hypothetical protein CAC42_3908 [Sphaceloma murrayae]|uniref:Uncharacterized protein n=1 Tax=Sphaceloma murrayae TaxID=2082308 RepID=A0A2K1QSJ5_9PEZI|nr:hypothetical protein CAC42_3908 [Sphaceloma murrayae]